MNDRVPKACLLALLVVILIPALTVAENSITLDTVMGDQFRNGQIYYTNPGEAVFVLRMTVDPGIEGKIESYGCFFWTTTSGTVTWSSLWPYYMPTFPTEAFDGGCYRVTYHDSTRFSGFTIFGQGVPPGYSEQAFALPVSFTDADPATDPTFCLDSITHYPPSFTWSWRDKGDTALYPTWGGPYCFEIVRCCEGMTGNINDDPNDNVDISDLTAMINYLFGPHIPIPCVDEADVTGDGTVDISDVVYFAKYLFLLGDPPAPCFGE